jgi:hypothetical protein
MRLSIVVALFLCFSLAFSACSAIASFDKTPVPQSSDSGIQTAVAEAVVATAVAREINQLKLQATAQAGEIANLQATVAAMQAAPAVQSTQKPNPVNSEIAATTIISGSVGNDWKITMIDVKGNPIVDAWLNRLRKPAPELWPTFPNVPNPLVPEFRVVNGNEVPDGLEYGEDDSPFCEYKQTCDWVVPAWHYRLISGDYAFTSSEFSYTCQNVEGQPRKGCLIVLFNVMDETYTWRDQSVDNGFTVMGRYWNGDALEWGAWGLVSHAVANMLNFPTMRDPTTGNVLNAGGLSSNAGANCGIQPNACGTVDATIIVHAGDRILAVAQTTVSK